MRQKSTIYSILHLLEGWFLLAATKISTSNSTSITEAMVVSGLIRGLDLHDRIHPILQNFLLFDIV
ncbi:hypothetical protein ACJX0J_037830, partial [Zea mays]